MTLVGSHVPVLVCYQVGMVFHLWSLWLCIVLCFFWCRVCVSFTLETYVKTNMCNIWGKNSCANSKLTLFFGGGGMGETLPPRGALRDRVSFSPGGGGGVSPASMEKNIKNGPRV